jgi:hypothetical protein
VANGRRRKKSIVSLNHGGSEIKDQKAIREAIYKYYKKLFGSQPKRTVSLAEGACSQHYILSYEDNEVLLKPFTLAEVKETVFEMREDSAPGPDGFGVSFYKNTGGNSKGVDDYDH